MNRKLTFTSAVVVAALSLAVGTAGAQARQDNGHKRSGGRTVTSQPAPRQEGARQAVPRQAPRQVAPQSAPRQGGARQAVPQQAPRQAAPQPAPRANGNARYQQRAVPRSDARPSYQSPSPRYDGRRGNVQPQNGYRSYSSRPYGSHAYVRPYSYVPYRPYHFSRPYYSFRPRFSIGFGLWLGYPVPYPYAYLGGYRPRIFGYYGEPYYSVSPGVSIYGGLSFDIQPPDADLFVDGEYVGPVGSFTPNDEPLTLTPGVHQIAIQRDGFRPMEWSVTIEPGQVMPYRGAMERY